MQLLKKQKLHRKEESQQFLMGPEWPPYSLDLNTCDFFLWGNIKDDCYPANLKTDFIVTKKVVRNIKDDMLKKVFTSFRKRIEFCTNSHGSHFENK